MEWRRAPPVRLEENHEIEAWSYELVE